MSALQNIQPPLGITGSPLRSSGRGVRSGEVKSFDTNETLLSNNVPSSESAIEALRKLRANDKLVMLEITMSDVEASSIQDLLQSRQQEIVFFQIAHHGTTPRTSKTQATARPETAELRWLREHQQDMARWRGQWLLIAEDQLLAHSANFREIKDAIARNNVRSPFTYYVPTEDEALFTLL
jgi:hypothetical protein